MTTLSDEEFQRLNDQLLELKTANYNLEASLSKRVSECSTLKAENEQLRRQSSVHEIRPESGTAGQSIKQKLNPFALAKNIANKVDARRNAAHVQPQASQTAVENSNSFELKSPTGQVTNNLAHRLESQELDFLKTNETLKCEINLLQSQLEQSEANNGQLRQEIDRLSSLASSSEDSPVAGNEQSYSPSRQLQHSLQVFAQSIASRQENSTVKNVDVLVNNFIDALPNETQRQEALRAMTSAVFEQKSLLDEDLMNTTEDFKKICQFFSKSQQSQLNEGKELVEALCTSFVNYEKQLRHEKEKCLNDSAKKHATELAQLQSNKQSFEKRLSSLTRKLDDLKAYKESVESMLEKLTAVTFEELSRVKSESANLMQVMQANLNQTGEKAREKHQEMIEKLTEKERDIETLNGRITESINEHKISEKRGFKLIKELKKQLNSEKNRADKLQSLLVEQTGNCEGDLVDGSRQLTYPLANVRSSDALTEDGDSSGSWSRVSYGANENSPGTKARSVHSEFSDIEIVASPAKSDTLEIVTSSNASGASSSQKRKPRGTSVNSISAGTLEQENAQLLARVGSLQQERWRLEEQVNQLEHETQRMASELADKSRLIEHYCIEGVRPGGSAHGFQPTTPTSSPHSRLSSSTSSSSISGKSPATLNNSVLRVVSFLKEKSDLVVNAESAKQMAEVNRKLQRMVEEILTKNMHLQSNLEELSDQLMDTKTRLRKYEAIPD